MYATQSEIARQLGISQATVSMALRGTGKMSAETRNRIQREAIKLGYRHNNSARAIRTGRFGGISLLLSPKPQHSHLPFELMPGIITEARLQQTQLGLIGSPDEDLVNEEFIHAALRRWSSDGLLINYTHNFPPQMVELIHDYRVPSIWINARFEHDTARPDDYAAAAQATHRLQETGHRRIGYLDLTLNQHYSGEERRLGYQETMQAAGLSTLSLIREVDRPERLSITRDWLGSFDRAQRPTAIVAYHEHEAQILYAAALSLQIRVPEELSLIAVHDFPNSGIGVALSMMQNDFFSVGAEAVKMLMQKIETPTELIPSRKIAPKWLPGVTVAPPA